MNEKTRQKLVEPNFLLITSHDMYDVINSRQKTQQNRFVELNRVGSGRVGPGDVIQTESVVL